MGILAHSVWGQIVTKKMDDKEVVEWILVYDQLSDEKPIIEGINPDDICRYREIRIKSILNFTKLGNPGEKLQRIADQMIQNLTFSIDVQNDICKQLKELSENKRQEEFELIKDLYGEGMYHITPQFFNTLIYLSESQKQFKVVFRTFGSDLSKVISEFNLFCNGEHPCFNGKIGNPLVYYNGNNGSQDLRILTPQQTGLYYRNGPDISQITLVIGSLVRTKDNIEEYYAKDISDEKVQIIHDPLEQYNYIKQTLNNHNSLALQDDFEFWKKENFLINGGKVLLIEEADDEIQQIFFDDNVGIEDDSNVDVKDAITRKNVPYLDFIDRYVVSVLPFQAILEPDYFIRRIKICEENDDKKRGNLREKNDLDKQDLTSQFNGTLNM